MATPAWSENPPSVAQRDDPSSTGIDRQRGIAQSHDALATDDDALVYTLDRERRRIVVQLAIVDGRIVP